jgi:PAS domain S-box-containing protein
MLALILIVSLALQLAVVYFALRLIKLTGKNLAWGLIAAAVTLMALRRIISLIDTAFSDSTQQADLAVEILALVISALLAFGLERLTHLVAEFRAASTRLKESETRYRMIFENSPISIWEEDFSAVKSLFDRLRREGVSDLDAHFACYPELAQECAHRVRIVDVNRAALALHGTDSKEALLAGLADTFTPESFQTFREELLGLWRGETEMSSDAVVKTLAGEPRHVAVTFAVCPGYEATLAKIFVSLVDVTARKQAEQERQRHVDILAKMDRIHRAIQKSDDLDAMMRNVLDEVLAIFGCDRVYLLYPCDPRAASWRVPMERHKPEYPGAGSLGVAIPMNAEIAAKLRLLRNTDGPLTFGPGNEHPLPAEVAARFGFKSMMAVALFPKLGQAWEFGLHQCDHARVWTHEDIRLLQKIGWRISDALTSFLVFENLRQSEEKYRQIIDTALEGVWLLDAEGRTTFVNARVSEIMGYAKDELLGRLASDFMFAEDVAEHRQKIKNRSTNIAESYERRMRRKNGETLWTIISASPIVMDNGGFGGSCAMLTDITARKQAELRLKQALEFTEGVINAIPDILLEVNAEGRYLNIWTRNPELLAAPKESLIGRTVHEMLPPEAAAVAMKGIREADEKGISFGNILRLDLPHGTHWFEQSLSKKPATAPSNEARFLVLSRDITERKLAEEKLRISLEFTESVLNAIPDVLQEVDAEGRYLNIWMGNSELLSAPKELLIGRTVHEILPPKAAATAMKAIREADEKGFSFGNIICLDLPQGSHWFEQSLSKRPAASPSGKPSFLVLSRDVTERQRMAEALRASEQRFRALFEQSFQFVGLLSTDGTLLEANRAALEFIGVEERAVLGWPFWDTPWWRHSAELRQRVQNAVREAASGKLVRFEASHIARNGSVRYVDFSLKPVIDSSGRVVQLIPEGRDITERKLAEEKLKASEERFRAIFRDAALGIALIGPDRRIIQANPALERLLGFTSGQIEGQAFENLFDAPERGKLAQCLARLDSDRQTVLDNDCHLLGQAGRELIAHVMLSSIQDDHGQAALTLALVNDLTERRAAAAREADLQARLAHLGRLGLMGELTATLAHELNNPLGIIANYAAGCAKRIASGAPPTSLLPALEKIGRQARLAGDIIQHTRSFVSKGEPAQGTATLAEALDQSLEFIETYIRQANAEITRQVAADLPPLAIPLVQLQQIFLNLLLNAIDAVQEQNEAPRRIWLRAAQGAAGMVEVTVADNGPLAQIPANLFDAFYTTKPSGLGMGLAICHTLVEKHGGRIWATLESAHGLAIHFILPAAANGHAR